MGLVDFAEIRPNCTEVTLAVHYEIKNKLFAWLDRRFHFVDAFVTSELRSIRCALRRNRGAAMSSSARCCRCSRRLLPDRTFELSAKARGKSGVVRAALCAVHDQRDSHGVCLVETQNLTRSESSVAFGSRNFFSIDLHAPLLNQSRASAA